MANPKILYSTNTLLAYRISRKFYKDNHYVWCAPKAGSTSLYGALLENPPTSQPLYRYKSLKEEALKGDLHGPLIKEQKVGLRKGAEIKLKERIITEEDKDKINSIVDISSQADYKPLLYIIPYENVKSLLKEVDIKDKAHPMSEEYIIESLPGDLFDIIDLDKI